MTEQRVHLAVPFKVATSGIYVNTACGAYVHGGWHARTEDREQVTCRSCQRTAAWKTGDEVSAQ